MARVVRFTDVLRRSRSRQISSLEGWGWPRRWTVSRRALFLLSTASTRRTMFLSADQKCKRHLPCSPDTEYLAEERSNAITPSSRTTPWHEAARNSRRERMRDSAATGSILSTGFRLVCDG